MAGSRPGERRGGRQAGTPNKITRELREMVLVALDRAGGVDYLTRQAKANPTAFLSLVGKLLPRENKPEDNGRLTLGELVEAAIEHGKKLSSQALVEMEAKNAVPLSLPSPRS
jgi:hypothetical protein